jgi:hypothetical protein
MAVPAVTANLTTISDCEAITGWSGDTFLLEPDNKKQGSNSLVCQMTVKGAIPNQAIFTPAAALNLTGQHIRCWFQSGLSAYVDTEANRGIEFWISDGTYTHFWTIGGSDNFPAGWTNLVVYAESIPTNGFNAAFDYTAVTSMGFNFLVPTTKPRGVDNFWVDYLRYGDGLTVTGGTSVDPITLDDIAAVDEANGYGIVEKSVVNGAISVFGSLNIGNGATTTYYEEDKTVAIFADVNVSSTLYKFIGQGTACNIDLKGFTLKGYNQTYLFDMNDADLNTLSIAGSSFSNASSVLFKAGQSITTSVFDSCGQIDPATAVFEDNTVSNSIDAGGALLWQDSANTNNNAFIDNDYALEMDTTSEKTLVGMTFSGSVTADINNTSGSAITVNLTEGANASTYAGPVVTFVNAKQFVISGVPLNAEYRLYEDSGVQGELGTVELQGAESWTGGDITYPFTYTADKDIILQVMHTGYEEYLYYGTLVNSNSSVTVVLTPEENV